jgi:hypothetical protein
MNKHQKRYIAIQKVRVATHEEFMKKGRRIGAPGPFRVAYSSGEDRGWSVKVWVFDENNSKRATFETPEMSAKPFSRKSKKAIRKVVRQAVKMDKKSV